MFRFSFQRGMFTEMPNDCCKLFNIYLSPF